MNLDEKIGQKIKQARISAGLSQTALAQKIGMSSQLMSKYEHGWLSLRVRHLMAISDAININIHHLIEGLLEDERVKNGEKTNRA